MIYGQNIILSMEEVIDDFIFVFRVFKNFQNKKDAHTTIKQYANLVI